MESTKDFTMRHLTIIVGRACNFKCKDCGMFVPISLPEFNRYDVNDIIRDLKTFVDELAFLKCLQIQGGEPFIYPPPDGEIA